MSLIDEIKINSLSDAQEILKAAGTEDLFEKAHKDGDLHPNGKWVWVSSAAGGKGDWRTLNGRTHKKHQSATAAGNGGGGNIGGSSKQTSTSAKKNSTSINPTFQKYFSISNSKFTDPKKMSVSKTPQGNWSLSYDGKRISTVAPLTDADKKKLESAGVTFDDTFKPKQKVKANQETYSHDINGVTVTVSKNKDGSYTLEANGKKVKSDDPSYFKDKLLPRVKKGLAKELGIEETPTKSNSKEQHIVGDNVYGLKYSDESGKKILLEDFCSGSGLRNGESKSITTTYKTEDGRSVKIDIKLVKGSDKTKFEVKNGSKKAISVEVYTYSDKYGKATKLRKAISKSIEENLNKGVKVSKSKKIETDGSKLTQVQKEQSISNAANKYKEIIQKKINKLGIGSSYTVKVEDGSLSVTNKNGRGGFLDFSYDKNNKLSIDQHAPLSGHSEYEFDESDIQNDVDHFFNFYRIK